MLEALPIDDAQLDVAMMGLVLHHVPDPARALGECARVLKPGGRALIIDMLPHDRAEYQQQMGHVWLGFPEQQMRKMLTTAGFDAIRIHPLADRPRRPKGRRCLPRSRCAEGSELSRVQRNTKRCRRSGKLQSVSSRPITRRRSADVTSSQ